MGDRVGSRYGQGKIPIRCIEVHRRVKRRDGDFGRTESVWVNGGKVDKGRYRTRARECGWKERWGRSVDVGIDLEDVNSAGELAKYVDIFDFPSKVGGRRNPVGDESAFRLQNYGRYFK
jgi:hypothetical protein